MPTLSVRHKPRAATLTMGDIRLSIFRWADDYVIYGADIVSAMLLTHTASRMPEILNTA